MFSEIRYAVTAGLLLAASFSAPAAEFRVRPDDGSFERAAKTWKSGDTILLAPGTYYSRFKAGSVKNAPEGITIKAQIPGTAIFRGDRKAPVFRKHKPGIWKAQWESVPEAVFEHDTLTAYQYCATLAGVELNSAAWTFDAAGKMLYIRTTDSADPARHVLSIGVTPWSGIDFYSSSSSSGVRNVLLDGFIVTGFYSRLKYPDERLQTTRKKVAWGVVINKPAENVKINNVTAVLNGYGIGFCGGAKNAAIENCRAFGNGNPFNHSGGGIGIFNGADNCIVRGNLGSDNRGFDIWLYSGFIKASTVFSGNRAYRSIRTKTDKQKGFVVRDCISMNIISFIMHPEHMTNSVTFGYTPDSGLLKGNNLLVSYEKDLKADEVFADHVNFDCRVQAGTQENIARRSVTGSPERVFYWKKNGNDSAGGRSVARAFATSGRVIRELGIPGTEIYAAGPVDGDLYLKKAKNIAIRGRGAFPVRISGRIILEDCSDVKLERLAPAEIVVRGGSGISVTQSAGKITAEKVNGLRLTHNYIPEITLDSCRNGFITANVFEKTDIRRVSGWSDYNAYAGKVPAEEKNSFTARAELGKNYTFRNAWQFDGRAIDSMPVGPYRRQTRNVQLIPDKPELLIAAPDTAVAGLSANIPFRGTVLWGEQGGNTVHKIKLDTAANTHTAAISGLKPGKKYFIRFDIRAEVPECFSNAELKQAKTVRKAVSETLGFTTPVKYSAPQQYFVSKDGSDLNDGSPEKPFRSIGYAVSKLQPGDTLTIRGGTYEENFSVPVSGTAERPVIIRGAPGERVFLQAGYGSPLAGGITVSNQKYIRFEDLCIYGNWAVPEGFTGYAIRTTGCRSLIFKRLLVCGASHKLHAVNCDDIRIEDCGFHGGHEGVFLTGCDRTVISHCTFAHAGVMQLKIDNGSRGSAVIENCIFVDPINMKGSVAVIHAVDIAKVTERNNCFFNRMPFDQKPLIGWDRNGKELAVRNFTVKDRTLYNGRRQQPYPAYQRDLGRYDTGSFSADPGLAVFPDFTAKYKSMDDWRKNWKKNERAGWEEARRVNRNPELLRDLKYFQPTAPEVIRRSCGPRLK